MPEAADPLDDDPAAWLCDGDPVFDDDGNVIPPKPNEARLLEEYYRGQLDIFTLARSCAMTIEQVLAWRDREDTRRLMERLDDFAERRARDILTQSQPDAAAALRGRAVENNPSELSSAKALWQETRRKAASTILRASGTGFQPVRRPDKPGNEESRPPARSSFQPAPSPNGCAKTQAPATSATSRRRGMTEAPNPGRMRSPTAASVARAAAGTTTPRISISDP